MGEEIDGDCPSVGVFPFPSVRLTSGPHGVLQHLDFFRFRICQCAAYSIMCVACSRPLPQLINCMFWFPSGLPLG